MAAAGDGWRFELKKYFESIENLSETALKTIKRDRARNHLPFDDSFKDLILKMANARIDYAYTNLMYEDVLEDEQSPPNQSVNHQNDGNVPANIGQQLATIAFNPEHIEQMPINLVQSNNQNSVSNATDSTASVQDGNQSSDQIIISIPSNQLSIPSDVEIEQNTDDGLLYAQSNGMELPGVSVVDEPLNVSNPLRTIRDEMIVETTSTDANDLQRMENLNEQYVRFETIDLTLDQEDEEMADTLASDRNDKGQTQRNVERQEVHKNISTTNDNNAVITHNNKEFQPVVVLDRNISHQNMESNSQKMPIAGRLDKDYEQRHDVRAMASGHLKKNKKLATAVNTMKRHKCDYCDYSTNNKTDLTRHIRTHTGEQSYECDVCEKQFTQKQHLNGHMRTHRDLFTLQCSNCRLGFAHKKSLKLHESRCKAKGYECHLCKRYFSYRKYNLVEHMRKHTGEKLRCSKCRKQFRYKGDLTRHMKMHGKLFQFQCSNCRQGFSHPELWKSHENRCKSKQFECHLCSKKFYEGKSHLLYHMRYKHTGEKPFGCSDCRKRFCSKSNLIRHTKCHNIKYN